MKKLKVVSLLGAIVLPILTGCAGTSPTSRFYILDSSGDRKDASASTLDGDLAVGVGPISIPGYLDRPQIVIRDDTNQLTLSEFDRWAGSLRENIVNVITDDLSWLLQSDRVVSYPWSGGLSLDYQVEVEVTRFEASRAGDARLQARWLIRALKEGKVIKIDVTNLSESTGDGSYGSVVAAQSRLLQALSREIADALLALPSASMSG
jgi:uncharacterized lipoprotein YmbA